MKCLAGRGLPPNRPARWVPCAAQNIKTHSSKYPGNPVCSPTIFTPKRLVSKTLAKATQEMRAACQKKRSLSQPVLSRIW